MKTIFLNKHQISNSIVLFLGSNKTGFLGWDGLKKDHSGNPFFDSKITGVKNFEMIKDGRVWSIPESEKFRIDKIVSELNEAELDYNKRQFKANKEFFIEKHKDLLPEEVIKSIEADDYNGLEIQDYFNHEVTKDPVLIQEINAIIAELYNTPVEISFTPFKFAKIEDYSCNDFQNYSFMYETFSE